MSHFYRPLFLAALGLLGLACRASAAERPASLPRPGGSQIETYTSADGESYFALKLAPAIAEPARPPHDLAILFDTSASQTGSFRAKALAALDRLLAGLDGRDRVALVAVDVQAVALTPTLVRADSAVMSQALSQLRQRVPLGSTDMPGALDAAANELTRSAETGRARSVVYIGDGMSTARLLFTDGLRRLMDRFVEAEISVNSYGVGPRVDRQLLGALAQHTGGVLLADRDDLDAARAGASLADMARSTVIWPADVQLPDGYWQVYFRSMPPLRFDRDTVLLGTMPEAAQDGRPVEIEVRGEASGKAVDLKWKLSPQPSNPDNAYLAKLVATARRDGALSLPTVGAAGLAELRSLVNGEAAQLAKLGQQALVFGEIDQAERLAREAAQLDPLNAQAEILQTAALKAQRAERANDGAASVDAARTTQVSQRRAAAPVDPEDGQLLDEVERQRRVYVQFLRSEVRHTVNAARGMMGADPEGAINMLKLLLEKVTQAPELEPDVRAQLRDQIEAALQTASQQAIVKTERDMRREEVAAEAQARQRINRELFLQEQKVDQLMARFNALMDEERYRDAEAVANIAEEMSPNTPGLRDAELTARMVGYTADMMAVVDARHKGVIDSLYQIELSLVPTPDEPPILYPDPEVWQLLTERRKKYKAVDLTESNPNEAKIVAALDDKTELEFVDQPLSDVVDYLKERHDIEIQLDTKALTDEGIGSDTPVTRNIKGITLRSALRLMLGEMDLTYVIRNEVLMITTKTEAENMLSTKVYPVADLVIPVGLRMGGGGMGGMGGMGMGGMGMGGGF